MRWRKTIRPFLLILSYSLGNPEEIGRKIGKKTETRQIERSHNLFSIVSRRKSKSIRNDLGELLENKGPWWKERDGLLATRLVKPVLVTTIKRLMPSRRSRDISRLFQTSQRRHFLFMRCTLRDLSNVLGDTLIPLLNPAFDHLYTLLERGCSSGKF